MVMTALRSISPQRVSDAFFRDFVASRPDGETWELIDGRIVMQAQPTFDHQIIAGNLERLLNDALERIGAGRIALQNPAVDLSPVVVGSQYVPDVGVIDAAVEPGARTTPTCYLVVEIASATDRKRAPGETRPRLDVKIETYERLAPCEAIVVVEQERFAVRVATRTEAGWSAATVEGPDAILAIPSAGLNCRLAEVYARTSLMRATAAPRRR
jgi:Uma2 family endonuclease